MNPRPEQLDLFATPPPEAFDGSRLFMPPRPRKQGDIARLWHGMHPHRTAWYYYDASEPVWRCIDPFDTLGINYCDTPPNINEHGRLVG